MQSLDHLAVVLSLLEPGLSGIDDFYVYYYTVQILNSCLKNGLYKLQVKLNATGVMVGKECCVGLGSD